MEAQLGSERMVAALLGNVDGRVTETRSTKTRGRVLGEQHEGDVGVAVVGRGVDRVDAVVATNVGVGAGREQQLAGLWELVQGREEQRRLTVAVLCVDVGALRDELRHLADLAVPSRLVERRARGIGRLPKHRQKRQKGRDIRHGCERWRGYVCGQSGGRQRRV